MGATLREWNPRYVAYAAAHGLSPASMLKHDRQAYPGGCMGGFVIWMSGKWADWRQVRGYHRDRILTDADHADFDAWLTDVPA